MSEALTWSTKWSWNQKDSNGQPLTWNGLAPNPTPNMPNTDINTATLSDADLADIKTSLAAAEAKMPFIQNLTNQDRKGLRKIGPERLSFVENAL